MFYSNVGPVNPDRIRQESGTREAGGYGTWIAEETRSRADEVSHPCFLLCCLGDIPESISCFLSDRRWGLDVLVLEGCPAVKDWRRSQA